MTVRNHTDPLIGTRLGDYTLQELLGRGGMARVYRGLDENLGRLAAVKVLAVSPEEAEDERILERFKLEARAIASFEHPNIVTIYQYGESQTHFFIAMKLVKGETLSRILRRNREQRTFLPPERVLAIVRDVCDALDYAHERGIVHRDIKPSNILFDASASDRAILTDFGLAMEIGGSTLGTAFGTPRYIAPEQAVSSQKSVPQSDIYSLGVIVYEMLTGQVPFYDESPMNIALHHITSPPPPLRSLNPAIPEAVEAVVLRALAKEPKGRYPTAGDFYRALEDAYVEAEVELPTVTVPQDAPAAGGDGRRASRWDHAPALQLAPDVPGAAHGDARAKPARRPGRRILWLAALLAVIGVLGGLWWWNGQGFSLPAGIGEMFSSAEDAAGRPDMIPRGVDIELELIYDENRFVLHNLTAYAVPLDEIEIVWREGGPTVRYTGADFQSPLPPGQCAWVRLLSQATLRAPDDCPNPVHYVQMVPDPQALIWVGRDTFEVLYRGRAVSTCAFADGRCAVTIVH
ncbi:MAG: serine/threonine protein kinase [Anaerolineae bacterium]|nr:serine/threonine protein kinase [Anaerolineae bacterium]